MNIFYFSGTKLPSQNAQSIHAMKMAQAFSKTGHDVTLFAGGVNNAASDDIFNIYDTEQIFKLYLSSHFNMPLISDAKRLLTFAGKIARVGKPDLVYGHNPLELALLAPRNTPVVFEAHGLPNLPSHNWAFSKLLKQKNLHSIVVVSDVLKQAFLKKYSEIEPADIFVAHDGADLIRHIRSSDNETNILRGQSGALNIGYTGSLAPGKGIALITRIAAIRPDYNFHIIGGTKKHVQKLETENTLKNLHFYGYRDHAEIPSYLEAFDIAVAPYQHRALIKTGHNMSRWISPMKIFEYMAAQKPIICSNLPTIHEILDHEHNALLLPASDEHKWGEAIDMIKDNPEKGQKLARNAYESLKEKYTWDKRAQAITDLCFYKHQTPQLSQAS
ncbi:MAG: hypothetical protein COB36_06760 [Alphaproteobacteria bacterium]|nr:MAG: hypothetical protein COB36_06760 [Alphaproteobacteria bacterium]